MALDHRHHRDDRGLRGRGLGGIARAPRHRLGGQVDLHGDRARWALRGVLRGRSSSERDPCRRSQCRMTRPTAEPEAIIRVRDLVVGFRRPHGPEGPRPRHPPRRDPGLRRPLRPGQVGPDPHDPGPRRRSGRARSRCSGEDMDGLTLARAPRDRAALGRAVPAGRTVLGAHRQAEHPGADARAPEPVRAPARRVRAC